jgi:hypothetical protein
MPSAFDNLAARVVTELIRDLDLTPEQAAGIVGNLGAESGLRAIQEANPTSGRGGWGWAQWTGPRRTAFEKWVKAHGFKQDSYEANYGFLLQELMTSEKDALRRLKLTKTAKAAAETFEDAYERAGVKAWASRVKFAERALALYKASPPPSPLPPPVEIVTLTTLQRDLSALSKTVADLAVQVAKLQAEKELA